ncbi:MAG TPA: phage head closure protein [Bacteroidales bacterium]|nr:phage head closure protein [Bacteroidales bacterium]
MTANDLKYKITLQKPEYSASDYSTNQKVTFADYKNIRAGITWIGGNKSIQNYELFTSSVLQFKIRYRTDIDETFQIKFREREYTITSPFKIDPQGDLIITAELKQQ